VDSVYKSMDQFYKIFFRKIIPEIPMLWYFYKNTPNFFEITF
jgi:hypothetical protein